MHYHRRTTVGFVLEKWRSLNGQFADTLYSTVQAGQNPHVMLGADRQPEGEEFDNVPSRHILSTLTRLALILEISHLRPVVPDGSGLQLVMWTGKTDNRCNPRQELAASERTMRCYIGPKLLLVICVSVAAEERKARRFVNTPRHACTSTATMASTFNPCDDCSATLFLEKAILINR